MLLVKKFERLRKFNRAISGIMFLLMLLRWNMMLSNVSWLISIAVMVAAFVFFVVSFPCPVGFL